MAIPSPSRAARVLLCAALWCVAAAAGRGGALAQGPTPRDEEDVLRVSSNLVQTDVMVFDRLGKFVDGLRREDFELRVDGKPQALLFFERVAAGGPEEARGIAAARGETSAAGASAAATFGRGRSVIFFVDDLHLSPQGVARARELLLKFVNEEMTPDTQAMVVSASGRVGFLQQFTNERAVLRAAVGRLSADARGAPDAERPPMSFYQAIQIDRGDRDMFEYFVQQTLYHSRPQQYPRALAETMVTQRARRIRRQAALLSSGVLNTLESAAAARSPAPGRRLLYFISEGFTLDTQEGDSLRHFRRVVDAAARSGTVVYTLDTRGLAAGMFDASSMAGPDIMAESGGGTQRGFAGYSPTAELSATQSVLRSLAEDTGGRALLNTNALEAALSKTLAETANYYLLAWRPEGVEVAEGGPRFRNIEVSVRGRPDLKARVRRGVIGSRPEKERAARRETTPTAAAPASGAAVLNSALNAPAPGRALPVELYTVFTNEAPGDSVLTVSAQLDGSRLEFFADANGRRRAEVEVACVVLDDRGKPVFSTGRRLTFDGSTTAASPANARVSLLTNFSVPPLAPGLYQVRVAARDERSGLVGSAFQWAEVPDLKSRRLALSSLVLAESRAGAAQGAAALPSVSRVFARTSKMLVQLHIYNAARVANGESPDLQMAIRVLNNGKEVLGAPPHRVETAGATDPVRIRYAAEIPLRGLVPGAYLLEISVHDRNARTSATRQLSFIVE